MTREDYRKVKSMNKEQLDRYLTEIHNIGFNKGVSAMSHQLAEKVDAGIRKTPGIGEKRYKELIDNINSELNKD